MKGLIIKEFLGLRRYFRILAVLMVLYLSLIHILLYHDYKPVYRFSFRF